MPEPKHVVAEIFEPKRLVAEAAGYYDSPEIYYNTHLFGGRGSELQLLCLQGPSVYGESSFLLCLVTGGTEASK